MHKDTFDWDPRHDQLYDSSFGITQLIKDPIDLYKYSGTSFTMDAPEESLTLQCKSSGVAFWGEPSTGNEDSSTKISIQSGSFIVDGGDTESALFLGGSEGITPIEVNIASDAIFKIQNLTEFTASYMSEDIMPVATIKLIQGGTFDIQCDGFSGGYLMQINDQARVKLDTTFCALNNSQIMISSVPDKDEYSLELNISGDETLNPKLELSLNTIFLCRGESRTVVKTPIVKFSAGSNFIRVANRASVFFKVNSVLFEEGNKGCFQIEQGLGVIRFASLTGESKPFNFYDMDIFYPEGMFNFITNEGANTGVIQIDNQGSAFEKNAILQRKLVAINGEPQITDQNLLFDWSTGNLVIYYKS